MKKILAVVFAAVILLSTAACGQKAPAPAASGAPAASKGPQKLVVAHKANPTGLFHPTINNVSANGPLGYLIYDTLVSYDSTTDSFNPSIATKWEYTDDTHIKFTLRNDIIAHDGTTKLKASDVIYTLTIGQKSGKVANYYDRFNLAECKAVDDTTVIIATKQADPYLFYTLANNALGIVCEAAVTSGGGADAQQQKPTAGTGPYKLVTWESGSKLTFARNEKYWGGKPYFDTIEVKIITDASARVMNLESGDVDVALDPVLSQVKNLDTKKFTIENVKTKASNIAFFNCTKAPFNDVKVRQAVALALDYETNAQVSMEGYGYVTDSFIPNLNQAYAKPDGSYTNYYKYNVEEAKKLLKESSQPNGFTFTLKYMENAIFKSLAELIMNQLKAIGVTVTLAPTASSVFYQDASNGKFDMYLAAPSNPDPFVLVNYFDGRLTMVQATGGTGWKGPAELDKLIDDAKVTMDKDARNAIFKKIQAIINANVPALTLGSQNRVLVCDNDLTGIKYTPFSDIDLSHAARK